MQLTDREILDACARAFGVELKWDGDHPYRIKRTGNLQDWNPLTDDGDCARMENKCGVVVSCELGYSMDSELGIEAMHFAPGNDAERRRASCLVVAMVQIEKDEQA